MAYECYGEKKHKDQSYNRFHPGSDRQTVVPGPLTKDQAEKIASELQASHDGLGGKRFEAVPE